MIGALVGGLLLFIWQFLSWTMLQIHQSQNQYTANQMEILDYLSKNLEEGSYFLPTVAPGASSADYEKLTAEAIDKPWAKITYNSTFDNNMGMNMFRGYVINFLSVLLLCWLLLKIPDLSFGTIILATLTVGIIGYFNHIYINGIWFEGNTIPDLIDTVVSWGLCGAWLGWWLKR